MADLKKMQKLLVLFLIGFSFNLVCACSEDKKEEEIFEYEYHESVDLGLPSGLKWATCNVGASSPEEHGDYYAWGETEVKSNYDWDTYKHYDTKGCVHIGSNISGTQYDVAHVKWGGDWHMPTRSDIKELVNNCTWTWTTRNGVNGRLFTGPNKNSIFLPATGFRSGQEVRLRDSRGCFWSATLGEQGNNAYHLLLDEKGCGWSYDQTSSALPFAPSQNKV